MSAASLARPANHDSATVPWPAADLYLRWPMVYSMAIYGQSTFLVAHTPHIALLNAEQVRTHARTHTRSHEQVHTRARTRTRARMHPYTLPLHSYAPIHTPLHAQARAHTHTHMSTGRASVHACMGRTRPKKSLMADRAQGLTLIMLLLCYCPYSYNATIMLLVVTLIMLLLRY